MSTDTLARLQNGLETEGQDFAILSTAVLPSGALREKGMVARK
jgi:hypothetical protein